MGNKVPTLHMTIVINFLTTITTRLKCYSLVIEYPSYIIL